MNSSREKTGAAPHACTDCGEAAYVPFYGPARCTTHSCPKFDQDIWVEHVMELPDEEVGQEFDIEDEDTQPFLKFPTLDEICGIGFGAKSAADPRQKKALQILEDAIDKMPKPFYLTKPS